MAWINADSFQVRSKRCRKTSKPKVDHKFYKVKQIKCLDQVKIYLRCYFIVMTLWRASLISGSFTTANVKFSHPYHDRVSYWANTQLIKTLRLIKSIFWINDGLYSEPCVKIENMKWSFHQKNRLHKFYVQGILYRNIL